MRNTCCAIGIGDLIGQAAFIPHCHSGEHTAQLRCEIAAAIAGKGFLQLTQDKARGSALPFQRYILGGCRLQ